MGSTEIRWPDSVTGNRNNTTTSNNLGELLRFGENGSTVRNIPIRTLGSVLNLEKRPLPSSAVRSNRTLLDIIREDPTGDNKKTWKYFRNKLRLKRAAAAWIDEIPVTDVVTMQRSNSVSSSSMNNKMMLRRPSTRIPASDPDLDSPGRSDSLTRNRSSLLQRNMSCLQQEENDGGGEAEGAGEDGEEHEEGTGETAEGEGGGGGDGDGPQRMSLMALLAETDRQMGLDGSSYMMGDGEEEEEEEEEEEAAEGGGGNVSGGGEYNNCCVCMVRHKGAAFIPCGHTFCRLCSRELWVQRGNCPLCNNFILEILDIF